MVKNVAFGCAVACALAALASPVTSNASIIYRMVGGICTDSNHGFIPYGAGSPPGSFPGTFGVGPKVCSDTITAEIRMTDSYIPGTTVGVDADGKNRFVESFFIDDGFWQFTEYFSDSPGMMRGLSVTLPTWSGPADIRISWQEGYFFRNTTASAWISAFEFGARNAPCARGSIVGPYPFDDCILTPHYVSSGAYDSWTRIPEPATITLVSLGLACLAASRKRKPQ